MSAAFDVANRVTQIERDIRGLQLQSARAPVALAGQSRSLSVTPTGLVFSIGDVVKCVAGTWSLATAADTGALVLGVVAAVSGTTVPTITTWGTRQAEGTPGAIYYVPSSGGPAATAAPAAPEWTRVVEVQISDTLRLVRPDILGVRKLTVDTCDDGTPASHDLTETTGFGS